jgi:elongator complex protein 1
VFEYNSPSASAPPPTLKSQFTFQETESTETFRQQITFSQNGEVLMLQRCITGSNIISYAFNEGSGIMEEKPGNNPTSVISTLSSFVEDGLVKPFAQDVSGNLHNLLPESQSLYGKFPINLPWVEMVANGDSHIAFGMSANGHLYANSRLLIKNCTSFLVTPAHLIFTTTTHLLKFVHVTDVNSMSNPNSLGPC